MMTPEVKSGKHIVFKGYSKTYSLDPLKLEELLLEKGALSPNEEVTIALTDLPFFNHHPGMVVFSVGEGYEETVRSILNHFVLEYNLQFFQKALKSGFLYRKAAG